MRLPYLPCYFYLPLWSSFGSLILPVALVIYLALYWSYHLSDHTCFRNHNHCWSYLQYWSCLLHWSFVLGWFYLVYVTCILVLPAVLGDGAPILGVWEAELGYGFESLLCLPHLFGWTIQLWGIMGTLSYRTLSYLSLCPRPSLPNLSCILISLVNSTWEGKDTFLIVYIV